MQKKRTPEDLKALIKRHQIGRLYLQGLTQYEIGERVGLDQGNVSRELARLRKEWEASAVTDVAKRKAEELARVDELERTAREAWERSCKPAETLHAGTTRGRTDKRGKPLPDLVKTYKTEKGQAGDPRFLDRIAWCIDERCKILGLLVQKHELGGKDGGPIVLAIEVVKPEKGGGDAAAGQKPDRTDD